MVSLRIEFEDIKLPKHDFIWEILRQLLVVFDNRNNELVQLTLEIVKNNFDHAQGKGYLVLEETAPRTFRFEIGDYGTEKFDLDHVRTHSTGKPGKNFNAGTGMIDDMSSAECFSDFKIDTEKGFTYSGVFKNNH